VGVSFFLPLFTFSLSSLPLRSIALRHEAASLNPTTRSGGAS